MQHCGARGQGFSRVPARQRRRNSILARPSQARAPRGTIDKGPRGQSGALGTLRRPSEALGGLRAPRSTDAILITSVGVDLGRIPGLRGPPRASLPSSPSPSFLLLLLIILISPSPILLLLLPLLPPAPLSLYASPMDFPSRGRAPARAGPGWCWAQGRPPWSCCSLRCWFGQGGRGAARRRRDSRAPTMGPRSAVAVAYKSHPHGRQDNRGSRFAGPLARGRRGLGCIGDHPQGGDARARR